MALEDLDALLHRHSKTSSPSSSRRKPMVMVVDDDPGVLMALSDLLSEKYEVIACASGAETLDAFHNDIQVVVLDIKMRDHDGFWVCDQIRRRDPVLPVIFYSAYQDAKSPFAIINEHQPFGYVAKGAPPKLLMDLVERAIRYFTMVMEGRRVIADLERVQSSMQRLKSSKDP